MCPGCLPAPRPLPVSAGELALLLAGGLVAGVVNTLAGGGSLLTVPILVLIGLPGVTANATNRVGILLQSATAAWRFRAEGVSGFDDAGPVLVPVVLGSGIGAFWVSGLSDAAFERLFGILMIALLIPTLRAPSRAAGTPAAAWPPWLRFSIYTAIGIYGGAFQAGVGLILVLVLARAGADLVRANAVKVVVILVFAAVAVAVFVVRGQVAWGPAAVLSVGLMAGAEVGARLAVRGGERIIRPVLALAVLALAARMLGLF